MLQDSSRGHVAVMATPKSASGQTRLRSSQGEVVHAELACPVSSDHHHWQLDASRSASSYLWLPLHGSMYVCVVAQASMLHCDVHKCTCCMPPEQSFRLPGVIH